jgi:hypothetical protein
MSSETIRPWIEIVSLNPDVLSEQFSEDIFALDLGPLADGNPNVPVLYRNPEQFFKSSYLTKGLRSLLKDVLERMTGTPGNRVIKLVTPFGGGKSHTLAALYHAVKNRKALNGIKEAKGFPDPGTVNVAVFDGQFFDATNGKEADGLRIRTLWGWIAYSLGGKERYEIIHEQDEARVAPGGDEILKILGDGPNLILMDEVLQYLISAGGVKVHQTTLRDETLSFIQRLTGTINNSKNSVVVFSLQSSKREHLEYASLFQTLNHLAARKDQVREPVEGSEILSVIQRRLLGKMPEKDEAEPVANAYQEIIKQMKKAYAPTPADVQLAEEEGIALHDHIISSYPFHPAIIDVMRERWAAIAEFQKTRGALRFLAACLRSLYRQEKSLSILGPADVPIQDAEVRLAFFKEVGQQSDFQAVLEHDLIGANARARRIDDRRAKENPSEVGKHHAFRIAIAILMYSFGGLRREGLSEGELLPPGIEEAELLSVIVGPELDSTTAKACLKELKEQCLYLHFDGVRYCFKKDPNVTLLIEREREEVLRNDEAVKNKIKEMLEARLAGHPDAIIWPANSMEIPDRDPRFLVAYLPLNFATKSKKDQKALAKEFFEKYGDKPRQYRNGLGLAIPTQDQVESLKRSVQYLVAIERVRIKAKTYNLTDDQKQQVKERESTEKASAESALLKLYMEVWLPKVANGSGIEIEPIAVGGRPLTHTLNEKKEALIHERIRDLLTTVQIRLFDSIRANKIVELFKLGENESLMGVPTASIEDGFYSFIGFTRLVSSDAIRKAIASGIQGSVFGYYSGHAPTLGSDGKYQIPHHKVRFGTVVSEDEIDLSSGFLIMPDAVPQPPPAPEPGTGGVRDPGTKPQPQQSTTDPNQPQKEIAFEFTADRDKLYNAWNAIANLAEMAGKVSVTVRASSDKGFDKNKLNNGVLEPLREEDLIE